MPADRLKYYAFFLPQFHECPYNNKWWGQGFTEWNNVKTALPKYEGHQQPKVPTEGYYDLSDKATLIKQFQNAKNHGIDGFVIYHYWYKGQRPLGKVMDMLLSNKDIEGNFSLCWANHSWTRSWSNRMGSLDVLIEQTYEDTYEEREKHYAFLNTVFSDSRYNKTDSKAFFQIYVPENIPNVGQFVEELRAYTRVNSGLELHISAIVSGWHKDWAYLDHFDSCTFFQAGLALHAPVNVFDKQNYLNSKSITSYIRALPLPIRKYFYKLQDTFYNKIHFFDYDTAWQNLLNQYESSLAHNKYKIFPSAFVDFDNTARYNNRARIIRGFTAEKFAGYLEKLTEIALKNNQSMVFINAWNEWGEGMYLEEDAEFGNKKLDLVLALKKKFNSNTT
jgi:hypothetical protein